jgi:hypothetical protein
MYVKFKKPYSFEGSDYEGVELDLDGLKGSDIEKAQENVVAERRGTGTMGEFSKSYCAHVAALAAKQPLEFFRNLPAREFSRVTMGVSNFLLDGVSEVEDTPSTQ